MNKHVHKREGLYFALRIVFSVLGVFLISLPFSAASSAESPAGGSFLVTLITYVLVIVLYFGFMKLFLVGHLKGNGVQVGEQQFPAVNAMVGEVAQRYGMSRVPQVFLVQSGGVLNAFATRFAGRDYIALYSDVFSLAEREPEVLKFILAHEMAHVTRKHVQKRFWTALSFYVPFLGPAYSRACEHTCDSFAREVSPQGARNGLLLLAAGKDLYGKVDVDQYLKDFRANNTFAVQFVEKMSSHPNLPKRIAYLNEEVAQA